MQIDIPDILVRYFILLASICVHEFAHAWLADRLGDPTQRADGRVTLNPQSHVDMIGTIILPLILLVPFSGPCYGWGKHVYPQSMYFKNRQRDEMLVMMAGPLANIGICAAIALIGGVVIHFVPRFYELCMMVIAQNALLAAFNFLPVPPLDGGYILKNLINMSEDAFMRYSQFSIFILLGIIFIPGLSLIITIPAALIQITFRALMVLIGS